MAGTGQSKILIVIVAVLALVSVGALGVYLYSTFSESGSNSDSGQILSDYLDRLVEEGVIEVDEPEIIPEPQAEGMLVAAVFVGEGAISFQLEDDSCDYRVLEVAISFDPNPHQPFIRDLVGKRIVILQDGTRTSGEFSPQISNIDQIRVVGNEIKEAIEQSGVDSSKPIPYEFVRQCAGCFGRELFDIALPVYSAWVDEIGRLLMSVKSECGRLTITVDPNREQDFDPERWSNLENQIVILRSALIESDLKFVLHSGSDIEVGSSFDL